MTRDVLTCAIQVVVCVLWLFESQAWAQQTDFELEPNELPVWEALERYRDDPICLRSVKARELTVLPGIALRTAHRIVNIVSNAKSSLGIEHLADSVCLTVEQMLVLASCTTLDCAARPFVRSAWTRIRDRDGHASFRADATSAVGRIGTVYDSTAVSAWLSATLDSTTVHLGTYRVGSGMGLLLGGSGRFGSTISARTRSMPDAPSIRAHTSTFLTGSFRGIALQHVHKNFSAVAGYSQHNDMRAERALFTAAQWSSPRETATGVSHAFVINNFSTGIAILALEYNRPSESQSKSVIPQSSAIAASAFGSVSMRAFDVRCEISMDNNAASAFSLVGHSLAIMHRPQWSFGIRHFSSNYRAPYASSISDASYISNEYGAFIATDARVDRWRVGASVDLHGSLAPRFGSPLPTRGIDMQVSMLGKVSQRSGNTLDLRMRYESDTEGWRPSNDAFTRMHSRTRLSMRGELQTRIHSSLRIRVRADGRMASFSSARASEVGWASYADVQWQLTPSLSLRARYTLFNAASIDVAPYYVETDALGSMRTVACSGQASRFHAAARFNFMSFATIAASIAFEDRTSDVSRPVSGLLQLDLRLPLKP